MNLRVSLIAREIVNAALAEHKTLNLSCAAIERRLEHSTKEANEALATNAYLQGVFDKVDLSSKGDVDVELGSPMAAKQLRIALIRWGAKARKGDQNVHQMTLVTDLDERQMEAQEMLNALSDQLELPVADISALVAESEKRAPKAPKPAKEPKAKKGA